MKLKLSVVIITFNEERNIERCLQSVMDISDDILIVDSNSNDKTEEICKNFPVRFISQPWLGFSEQKNIGNQLAKNNWILSIDADEALSKELKDSIKELETPDERNIAFEVKRLTNYCGKWIRHCSWYPDKKLRLWNKNFAKWQGDIHESLHFSENPEKLVCLHGDLLHYSYFSIRQHFEKINSYTDILSKNMLEKGKKANMATAIVKSIWSFLRCYIFWLGFLDGYYGFVISCFSSQSSFLKYLKLIELRKDLNKKEGSKPVL
jgi:glycosyltransferase involved in cell wall biosynthesis